MSTVHRRVAQVWPALALLGLCVAAWDAWVRIADVEPSVFPSPGAVATALVDTRGSLTGHAATTIAETLLGLGIGTAAGIAVAVLIASSAFARRAVEPLLVIIQTIPPLVLAPVFVLAFGFGWTPRVLVVVLIVFFPVAVAAAGAFLGVEPERVDLVRSLGGSRRQVLRHVILPGALPAIFDGLRVSAAYSVAGAAIAEQIGGARSGLGLYIARSLRSFRADQVLAGVVVIAALSLALYALVTVVERRLAPWHGRTQEYA